MCFQLFRYVKIKRSCRVTCVCSPSNRFHYCLVNSISFSCLDRTAFIQITEILLMVCPVACESGLVWCCDVNRTSTKLNSFSFSFSCPSTCDTQSLTCPRPCSPTYETHIPACPKRDRGTELSFSFELHLPHLIRIPTHYSIMGCRIPWGSWLKLNQTAERFPRDWTSPWQFSSSAHPFVANPTTTALKLIRSSGASFTFVTLSSAGLLPSTPNATAICPTLWRCWTIEVQSCPFPCSGSLHPHWVHSRMSRCLPTRSWCFHVLFPTVCFLCGQFTRTNCSSFQTFAAHHCETDIQVLGVFCLSLLWH